MKLVIIDSGGANLGSVSFALQRLGVNAEVTIDKEQILSADKVILPGVGAAADAMQRLHQHGLSKLIPQLQQPVLGICLGLQLMYSHSAEGDTDCLGIFPGRVRHFPAQEKLRIPHMGWNQLSFSDNSALAQSMQCSADSPQVWTYFVHSYYAPVDEYTQATSTHGVPFTAIARKQNFFAAQFHPERSAQSGAGLLRYFLALNESGQL